MARYALRRAVGLLPTWLAVSMVGFLFVHLAPGGPLARLRADPRLSAAALHRLAVNLHLLQPWPLQYWRWLRHALQGNLGHSLVSYRPVATVVVNHLYPTLLLMGSAFVLSAGFGLLFGLWQALRPGIAEQLLGGGSWLAVSMPSFLVGYGLLEVFAVRLGWLPAGGMLSPGAPFSWGDLGRHLILPASTLALGSLASHSRYLRAQASDVLGQAHVRAALARGLSRRRIVWHHVVPHALLPVVTVWAMDLGTIFGGAMVTENVFAWPGMGTLTVQAVTQLDYPVVLALMVLSAILISTLNLLADLAYAWLDPRVRE